MKQKVFLNPSYAPMEINEKLIEVPQYRSAYSDIQADIILSGKTKKRKFGHLTAEKRIFRCSKRIVICI